jgi:hypothetical protein
LSIYFSSFFSMTPFSFCKKRNLFWVLIFGGWMACFV